VRLEKVLAEEDYGADDYADDGDAQFNAFFHAVDFGFKGGPVCFAELGSDVTRIVFLFFCQSISPEGVAEVFFEP